MFMLKSYLPRGAEVSERWLGPRVELPNQIRILMKGKWSLLPAVHEPDTGLLVTASSDQVCLNPRLLGGRTTSGPFLLFGTAA